MKHQRQPSPRRASVRARAPGLHPSPEQLEALEDGELAPGERRRVLSHLDRCASCRQALQEQARALSESRLALSSHPRIAAPQGFDARVWESIAARQQQHAAPLAPMARLGRFLLLPVPRLFSSAMFGLLWALALGQVGRLAAPLQGPQILQPMLAQPSAYNGADASSEASLMAMHAMDQRQLLPLRGAYEPQVLAPVSSTSSSTSSISSTPRVTPAAPQPSPLALPERRSQENFSWPNPARPSRAASSSDAGSLC